MDIYILLGVVIASFAIFILYYIVLIKFNVIRRPRALTITDPKKYAEHHVILKGRLYSKMSSRVLHKAIFHRTDVVSNFRWVTYPVFVIFGPHLCYNSYRFLRAFKENKNIRLFQIREETYKDASDEERKQIEKYLKEREYGTIVDGVHCYIENPHEEGEERGGTEYLNNPALTSKYEQDFDRLLRYCKEVDRENIIDSVGEENIYLTREDGTYGRAPHEKVVFLKVFALGELVLKDTIGYGEDELIEKLRKKSGRITDE